MDCLSDVGKTVKLILENGCTQPLLLNKNAKQECADQECDGNKDDDDDNDDEYSKKKSQTSQFNNLSLSVTYTICQGLVVHSYLSCFGAFFMHSIAWVFNPLAKCSCVKWWALVIVVAISLFFYDLFVFCILK